MYELTLVESQLVTSRLVNVTVELAMLKHWLVPLPSILNPSPSISREVRDDIETTEVTEMSFAK